MGISLSWPRDEDASSRTRQLTSQAWQEQGHRPICVHPRDHAPRGRSLCCTPPQERMVLLFFAVRRNGAPDGLERLLMVMERFATNESSPLQTFYSLGRALLIRCVGPLGGPELEAVTKDVRSGHLRIVIVDATRADYADSDGLRWLLSLRSAAAERGIEVRVAACEGGNIWRNILLLRVGLPLYTDVQSALHGSPRPQPTAKRKEAARA